MSNIVKLVLHLTHHKAAVGAVVLGNVQHISSGHFSNLPLLQSL